MAETHASPAAPDHPLVSDKRATLFAKWPTTKWFAIPPSMAEAMASTGAEILTAEEMIARKLLDKSGASGVNPEANGVLKVTYSTRMIGVLKKD